MESEAASRAWVDVAKDEIKAARKVYFSAILFAFLVGYTILNSYTKIEQANVKLRSLQNTQTQIPPQLRTFYERGFTDSDAYISERLKPWFDLSTLTSMYSIAIQSKVGKNPKSQETNDRLAEAVKLIGGYNANVRLISSRYKAGIPFGNLDRQDLATLASIIDFEWGKDQSSTRAESDLKTVQDAASLFLTFYQNDPSLQRQNPKVYAALRASSDHPPFQTLVDYWIANDMYGADPVVRKRVEIMALPGMLISATFKDIGSLETEINDLKKQVEDLRASPEVDVPVLGIKAPLISIFWIGALFNFALLIFLIYNSIPRIQEALARAQGSKESNRAQTFESVIASYPLSRHRGPIHYIGHVIAMVSPGLVSLLAYFFVQQNNVWSEIILVFALLVLVALAIKESIEAGNLVPSKSLHQSTAKSN